MGINFGDFNTYDRFLRDDSVATVSQTGVYFGAPGIEEYVRFAIAQYSPYFQSDKYGEPEFFFDGYAKETGQCVFILFARGIIETEPTTARPATFSSGIGAKVYLDYKERYITRGDIFFNDGFMEMLFGNILNTPQTRQHICSVMENQCSGILDKSFCLSELEALPALRDGIYIDNVSQGCRALHSVFAMTNPAGHCPHLAFPPGMVDPKGELKCQISEQIRNSDLFTEKDMERYRAYLRKQNIDPDIGFTLTLM